MPITNRPEYFKYLEAAKRAELAAQMEALGYHIEFDLKAGDLRYDMVAKRGDEKLAFEFKARDLLRDTKKEIEHLTRAAKKLGYDFRLVVVNPPREPVLEIEDLDGILRDYLVDSVPQELYDIASHPSVDSVVDVEIDSLQVTKEHIRVAGIGTLEVTLVYGGGGEDGLTTHDEYPFKFDVTLDHELDISRMDSLVVDVSSFYE
jgi:hypothetical protein